MIMIEIKGEQTRNRKQNIDLVGKWRYNAWWQQAWDFPSVDCFNGCFWYVVRQSRAPHEIHFFSLSFLSVLLLFRHLIVCAPVWIVNEWMNAYTYNIFSHCSKQFKRMIANVLKLCYNPLGIFNFLSLQLQTAFHSILCFAKRSF